MTKAMGLEALAWDDEREQAFRAHAEAGLVPARVASEHRGAFVVRSAEGELRAVVRGRLRDEAVLAAGLPAVGDWVALRLVGDGSAAIEAVLPRRTAIVRKTAWQEAEAQVLAANVDTVLVVSDLQGDLSPRRLERYLALVAEGGAEPVVVLTKLDLPHDPNAVSTAEDVAAGAQVLAVSNVTGEGLDRLSALLHPRETIALIGSSGVGKSTLINRLAGDDVVPVGDVRRDGRGRHTTRHRELFMLPGGALLVDTPGLRELQLWDGDLDAAFPDLVELAGRCRFSDCAHLSEPGCAVQAAIAEGTLDAARLASYRELERELATVDTRRGRRVWAEKKRRWRDRAHETGRERRHGREVE